MGKNNQFRNQNQVQPNVKEVETPKVQEVETIDTPEEELNTETVIAQTLEQPPVADTKIEEVAEQNNTAGYLLLELDQYAAAMKPGIFISGSAGAVQQLKLYRLIDRVMNRVTAQDFIPCINTLLEWFDKHNKDLTSDQYLFRFAAEWSSTKESYEAFNRLATLCKLVASPLSRRQLIDSNSININYLTAYGLTEKGRERLLAYLDK